MTPHEAALATRPPQRPRHIPYWGPCDLASRYPWKMVEHMGILRDLTMTDGGFFQENYDLSMKNGGTYGDFTKKIQFFRW